MGEEASLAYPQYVLVRSVDGKYANAADLPDGTPICTIETPVEGVMRRFLPIFTSVATAKSFTSASQINGAAVAINSPSEAVAVLELHQNSCFGVLLDSSDETSGTAYPYGPILDRYRELAADEQTE